MMTKERSWEVQGIVGNIDANKSAAVNQLLTEWQANLDPTVYDVWAELSDIAMKAPAWQIYAAALTGDFNTMTNILLGRESAGKYINALSAPQQKVPMGFGRKGPMVLGDYTQSLVYTPIAPCRMVDTRGSGARTGVIAANATRSFDVTTNGFSKGQGSATSCTGLPGYSYAAWALNVTVTNGYVAAGGLKRAVEGARASAGHMVKIEVEVDTLAQLDELLAYKIDVVLLDNMSPAELSTAVARIGGRAVAEASGGITLEGVRAVAEAGVDLISSGWITHSAPRLDVALDVVHDLRG